MRSGAGLEGTASCMRLRSSLTVMEAGRPARVMPPSSSTEGERTLRLIVCSASVMPSMCSSDYGESDRRFSVWEWATCLYTLRFRVKLRIRRQLQRRLPCAVRKSLSGCPAEALGITDATFRRLPLYVQDVLTTCACDATVSVGCSWKHLRTHGRNGAKPSPVGTSWVSRSSGFSHTTRRLRRHLPALPLRIPSS